MLSSSHLSQSNSKINRGFTPNSRNNIPWDEALTLETLAATKNHLVPTSGAPSSSSSGFNTISQKMDCVKVCAQCFWVEGGNSETPQLDKKLSSTRKYLNGEITHNI